MKKLSTVLAVVVASFLNASAVLADGGVYTPYSPHTPVDTGFEAVTIYVAALVVFAVGIVLLSTAKTLREKLSK